MIYHIKAHRLHGIDEVIFFLLIDGRESEPVAGKLPHQIMRTRVDQRTTAGSLIMRNLHMTGNGVFEVLPAEMQRADRTTYCVGDMMCFAFCLAPV